MQWIINELLNQGAIVVNVNLWGHGNNPIAVNNPSQLGERLSSFKQVTWDQWMLEVIPAIDIVESISTKNKLPKYIFGFSLGGLIGASISMNYDAEFNGYFLLAPAIKIKTLPE